MKSRRTLFGAVITAVFCLGLCGCTATRGTTPIADSPLDLRLESFVALAGEESTEWDTRRAWDVAGLFGAVPTIEHTRASDLLTLLIEEGANVTALTPSESVVEWAKFTTTLGNTAMIEKYKDGACSIVFYGRPMAIVLSEELYLEVLGLVRQYQFALAGR